MTSPFPTPAATRAREPLPVPALVVMACTGFIVIMTETMPAGLLPRLATGLGVSEGGAGQLVSAYAIGTVLAAIPAAVLTRGARRKPLLLAGLLGFLVANTVTTLAPSLPVALGARFVAGAFSGLLWGMLAGYARRIAAPEQAGRALAIAMTGTPVALSAGTPLGAWLGSVAGWRWAFAAMSLLTAVVMVFAQLLVPDVPGQRARTRVPLTRVLGIPGVATILVVVFVWMLAHNLLYTYIAPYLRQAHLALRPDLALVVFGVAALGGIWITGVFIDHALRRLTLVSVSLFIVSGATFVLGRQSMALALLAIVVWGIAFGGAATHLQTAMGEAAGENADVANALLTTSFNLAIFAGGALGAVVLDSAGASVLPAAMIGLALIALVTVGCGRHAAFPAGR
ncbi:MFS transporter [Streptomyces demainii]|uniref:MFS family arabinose efflux permease n=1 Tax=Streptomyces demainii TaxID=588122 RepID=A0ABT9KS75_9ACTN|nr:MFS transporter [Streptomyces demainii]MDP9610372.1 putative MFS family arabinose efflux permease [Streptomyces demainii]